MIQIKKHSECQNSVFENSTYGDIKFRAIAIDKFPNDLLTTILDGMTKTPTRQLFVDITERLYLLQEIRVACQRNKWDHPDNHFIVIGYGVGQILTLLKPLGESEIEEEEDMARLLITKHPNVFCIMDTDLYYEGNNPRDSGYTTKLRQEKHEAPESGSASEEIPLESNPDHTVLERRESASNMSTMQQLIDQENVTIQQYQLEIEEAQRINERHRDRLLEQDQEILHLRAALSQMEARDRSHPYSSNLDEESRNTTEVLETPEIDQRDATYDVRPRDNQLNHLIPTSARVEHISNTVDELRAEIRALRSEREELGRIKQEKSKSSLFSFENEEEQPRKPRTTLSLIRSDGRKSSHTPGVTFESRDFKTSTRSPREVPNNQTLLTSKRTRTLPKPKFMLPEEDESEIESEPEETTSEEEVRHKETPRIFSTNSKLFEPERRSRRTLEKDQKRPYKAWTLKQLGIRQFDPDRNDLLSHIEKVSRILEEVNVTPESQKIRLLMASFPEQLDYYEKVVSNENKGNYQKFAQELLAIMGSKVRITAHEFMQCHRKPTEDVLHYFFRITDLYKGSQGLMGDTWQDEPVHANHIYTKLFQSLYEPERAELERKLDRYIERGKLTVARLKKELIRINKMATTRIKAEAPNKRSILTVQAQAPEEEPKEDHMKNIRCYHCNKMGHYRSQCFERQRQLANESANWRPNNYSYNSRGRGSLFNGARGRGFNPNWRQPTRPPWQRYSSMPDKETETTQVKATGDEDRTISQEN